MTSVPFALPGTFNLDIFYFSLGKIHLLYFFHFYFCHVGRDSVYRKQMKSDQLQILDIVHTAPQVMDSIAAFPGYKCGFKSICSKY